MSIQVTVAWTYALLAKNMHPAGIFRYQAASAFDVCNAGLCHRTGGVLASHRIA